MRLAEVDLILSEDDLRLLFTLVKAHLIHSAILSDEELLALKTQLMQRS